jgi:LemA protein
MSTTILVILGLIAFVLISLTSLYNRLVTLRNQVKNAWSQIDVQLQRRYDLIPNLIETVKGYMTYEKGTLEAVIQARNQGAAAREAIQKEGGPVQGASIQNLVAAESVLKEAIPKIFALAESYPELKASENMKVLQEELTSTENRIAFARQAYNDQAMEYNTAQQVFPSNMIANFFGHQPVELYQVSTEEAKKAVKVSF